MPDETIVKKPEAGRIPLPVFCWLELHGQPLTLLMKRIYWREKIKGVEKGVL